MTTNGKKISNLEGAPNFRDIGGRDTTDGKKVRTGIIYRSDELSRLTDNDVKIFEQFNIKLICDLRSLGERKSRPDRMLNAGIRNISIPMNPQRDEFSQKKIFIMMQKKAGELDFDKLMRGYYQRFVSECGSQVKEIITLLADPGNIPAVIHCTAGKDRTGFIAAVIQLLAGVSRKDVIDDYLATNKFIEERTKKLIRYLRLLSLYRISSKRLQPMLEADARYLEEALDIIMLKYTSVEEYLTGICKIDKGAVNSLKNMLVAD